jgi:hypothetical protein
LLKLLKVSWTKNNLLGKLNFKKFYFLCLYYKMGKSLDMNYANCALLVVVLILVVVCCCKKPTEGFKFIQVTEAGVTYPNKVSCTGGDVCDRVRARQYNWLRQRKIDHEAQMADYKSKCIANRENAKWYTGGPGGNTFASFDADGNITAIDGWYGRLGPGSWDVRTLDDQGKRTMKQKRHGLKWVGEPWCPVSGRCFPDERVQCGNIDI